MRWLFDPKILPVHNIEYSFPRMSHFIFQRQCALPLHPSSHGIGISPDPQNVPAYNLASIKLADTLLQHLSHEIGELRYVLKALRCTLNTVEIGTNAYVVVANHISNVLDVLHHLLQSRGLGYKLGQARGAVRSTTADEVRVRIHHDNTTRSLDIRKYMVGNIARMRADGISARVTEDWWCNAASPAVFTVTQDVGHGILTYMTEVNEHTQPVHLFDQFLASR
jgi:hypothetical protein